MGIMPRLGFVGLVCAGIALTGCGKCCNGNCHQSGGGGKYQPTPFLGGSAKSAPVGGPAAPTETVKESGAGAGAPSPITPVGGTAERAPSTLTGAGGTAPGLPGNVVPAGGPGVAPAPRPGDLRIPDRQESLRPTDTMPPPGTRPAPGVGREDGMRGMPTPEMPGRPMTLPPTPPPARMLEGNNPAPRTEMLPELNSTPRPSGSLSTPPPPPSAMPGGAMPGSAMPGSAMPGRALPPGAGPAAPALSGTPLPPPSGGDVPPPPSRLP